MTKNKTQPSRLTKALLETADDMRRAGVMNAATHAKITLLIGYIVKPAADVDE